MNIPNDPFILLSFINTKLRDEYPDIDTLCRKLEVSSEDLYNKLNNIGYIYDYNQNQFLGS